MAFSEIRYAMRSLARVPGLTAISILTVTLGLGAGSALFSVVKAVLLNPLPYAEPGRLAWLVEINEHGGPMQVAFQNFLDWRAANRTFSAMGAYEKGPAIVSGSDVPQHTFGAAVTDDFFRVMGTNGIIGRTFSHEEQVIGGPLAVVIVRSLATGFRRKPLDSGAEYSPSWHSSRGGWNHAAGVQLSRRRRAVDAGDRVRRPRVWRSHRT